MTLNETVLQKIANWRLPGTGRHILAIPDEGSGWNVALTAERNDDLGCLIWETAVQRTAAPAPGTTDLTRWAHQTAKRATSLVEMLKVVEIDVQRNEALLRSDPASERGNAVFYYEVLLKGTSAAIVRRFQAFHEDHKRRQQILFPLTHEALAKLAADLTADSE